MMKCVLYAILTVLAAIQSASSQTVINGSRQIVGGGLDAGKATYTRVMTGVGTPASTLCNTAKTITAATAASPPVVTSTSHGFNNGDIIVVYGTIVGGMTGLTGTFAAGSVTTNTFALCGAWDGTNCQSPPTTSGTYTSGAVASSQVGREYFRQDATAGQNKYYCTDATGSPVWTQQSGGGGGAYATVQTNGSSQTQRTTANVVGANVVGSDVGGATTQISINDPISTAFVRDDFFHCTSASIGDLNWTISNGGTGFAGCLNQISGGTQTTGFPGQIVMDTSGSINTLISLSLSTGEMFNAAETFTERWIISGFAGTNATSNVRLRFGLAAYNPQNINPTTDGMYLEKLEGDTNGQCVTRSGSVQQKQDTGVAFVSTKTALQIKRTSGSAIECRVASTLSGLASATPTSNTTTIPTVAMVPVAMVYNTAAEAKFVNIDYFDLLITGLTR